MDNRQHRRHPPKVENKAPRKKQMTNAEFMAFQTVNEARLRMKPKTSTEGTRVLGQLYHKPRLATYMITLSKAERKLPKEQQEALKQKYLFEKRERDEATARKCRELEKKNDRKS